MEQLLPWVERELKQFRRHGAELALKYPRVAGQLGATGKIPRDPHVDRLVQAAAVLHARITHSMDRASPLLDEALLESLFPGQLRPFAASAVFRLAQDAPCGSMLNAHAADGRSYRFRLTAAASGSGVALAELHWRPYAGPGKEHLLSLTFADVGAFADGRLRLYANAEPVLRAALLDALLMTASAAWLSADDGRMLQLSSVPFSAAGLGEIGQHAWQVLREYQCFAERFSFIELDLVAVMRHAPAGVGRLTLHVSVPVRADSDIARTLSRMEAGNLLTGCAPAVNLFPAAAAPVDVSGRASEYDVAPADPAHLIWSIDGVHLLRGQALEVLHPPQTMRYGETPAGTWTARRTLQDEAGPPMRIAFTPTAVDVAAHAAGMSSTPVAATASVALTCCDRAMASALQDVQPQAAAVSAITRLQEVEGGRALRWRLLAMLALEARSPDLESLRLALSLQDLASSDAAQKLQSALVAVQLVPATLQMRFRHGAAPIDGTEVRITIDQRALVGASVAMFVHVLDQYLSYSVHLNSFMQLVAISAESGEELMRCRPRNGDLIL